MHNCRKHIAEQLRVPLDSVGYRSFFDTQHKQRVTFEDKKDEVISNDGAAIESGNREAIDIDQSNANKIQNMQIESVMNGVSEMLWEDLQIGERIGIGNGSVITIFILL